MSIRGFKHGGLKRFFDNNGGRRSPQDRLNRIDDILAKLSNSDALDALRVPGYRLHPLKGDRKGFWSVRVSANWRIVFRFEDGNAYDVDIIDYH